MKRDFLGRPMQLVCGVFLCLAGCDPCAGVSACGEPTLTYRGQVVVHLTEEPAVGVQVVVKWIGGIPVRPDSVVTVTDEEGFFLIRGTASEVGSARARLTFNPPPPFQNFSYSDEVEMSAFRAKGDERMIGAWGIGPLRAPARISYIGDVAYRYNGSPMVGAEVEFRREAGPRLAESDVLIARTDAAGRFALVARLMDDDKSQGYLKAEEYIYGVLTIRPEGSGAPIIVPSIRLSPSVVLSELKYLGRWSFGHRLAYVGELMDRATWKRLPNVQVEFRRTGGIELERDTFQVSTNSDGRFLLEPRPLSAGEVTGDLVIRAPGEEEEVLRNMVFKTFDTDFELRFFGVFGVGPRLAYTAQVRWADNGAPVENATVRFRRTGGIPVFPSSFELKTDAAGGATIELLPSASGTLFGEVAIESPDGVARVVKPISLETFKVDGAYRALEPWELER